MVNHIRKSLDELKQQLLALSALVEENVSQAVHAFEEGNSVLARKVMDGDQAIDKAEVDLEEECLKVLALYQPVANDLRFIISVLKINNDLERIGDLAVNISEHAIYLNKVERPVVPFELYDMVELARDMLRKALDSFVTQDGDLALAVCALDDQVDDINRDIYDRMKALMKQKPDQLTQMLHIISASRHIERIADHATNIAEDVVYMIQGDIVRHHTEEYEAD